MRELRIIMLCVTISLCCACSNKALPISEYPLNKTTIETALDEVGFLWTISDGETWGEGRIYYELYDNDKKRIAFISSIGEGSTRVLQIDFFSSTDISVSLPVEDWERMICLATILYGGFENKNQVYEDFQSTYEEKFQIDSSANPSPQNEKIIQWRNEVNGVNC